MSFSFTACPNGYPFQAKKRSAADSGCGLHPGPRTIFGGDPGRRPATPARGGRAAMRCRPGRALSAASTGSDLPVARSSTRRLSRSRPDYLADPPARVVVTALND